MPIQAASPGAAPLYLRPADLSAALAALDQRALTILAGGTDFYPARVGRFIDDDVLDITAIEELKGIHEQPGHWRIGGLATWSDLIAAPLPPLFDGLKQAAREIGGVQIQNVGTIAGNLCNASPAADGAPPLLALDAEVELRSAAGVRRLAVADFLIGNRETQRRPDEILTAIVIPKTGPGARSTFLKLGSRRYLVISIVMVAGCLEPTAEGTITRARIAVGSASAVARRLPTLEGTLRGKAISAALADLVEPAHLSGLDPISDVRATSQYRQAAAVELVRRTIAALVAAP
ncbi:MAG: FAD binding domain-containing protein [Pseudomonadota bacterium]|nr:FAD binding domain-containing protein [Pseudomonadota bacterium]